MQILRQMPRTMLKVGVVAFVGLHIPLVVLGVYALTTGSAAMLPILALALGSTLIAVAGTLAALFYILQDPLGYSDVSSDLQYQ
jgi:hypothetical protein